MFTEINDWRKSRETYNITIRYQQEDTFSIYPRPKHYLQILSIDKKLLKSGAPLNCKRTVQISYTPLFTLTYQH